MKFTFIAHNFEYGGAANGAKRWSSAIKLIGHDVTEISNNDLLDTLRPLNKKIRKLLQDTISRVTTHFMYKLSRSHRGNLSLQLLPSKYSSHINSLHSNYVFINWIAVNTIGIRDITRIESKVIIVLHDFWFFSGMAHFPEYLALKKESKIIKVLEKIDMTHKSRAIKHAHRILCMSEDSKRRLPNRYSSKAIALPYPSDIANFYLEPESRISMRKELEIDNNKVAIFFGADAPLSDLRKGFEIFREALNLVDEGLASHCNIYIFGDSNAESFAINGFEIRNLGKIESKSKLRSIYNSADIVVVPSRFETFGLISAEAQMCGSKVIVSSTACSETILGKKSKVFQDNSSEDLSAKLIELVKEILLGDLVRDRAEIANEAKLTWESSKIAYALVEFLN